MNSNIHDTLNRLSKPHIWDEQPVFSFTSDIDWASEPVMEMYFRILNGGYGAHIKPTLFCTHKSQSIDACTWDKGIHPNFLPRSTQSKKEMNIYSVRDYYERIIESCNEFVPSGTKVFRSHRAFDVTDTNHMLKEKYGFEYCSNYITIMQRNIKPVLHESGLINFPVFFEDGTHLYNKLDLKVGRYMKEFESPGIKVISFHPMNFVLNSPSYQWMRGLKDRISSQEYQALEICDKRFPPNEGEGIRNTILDIMDHVILRGHKIYSLKELYEMI